MSILVVGASGATGRHVVSHAVEQGQPVKAVVRTAGQFPESVSQHQSFTEHIASIHDLNSGQLERLVAGVDTIVSCLGHNLTFKGMFGKPRRLVTDVVRGLCEAAQRVNSDRVTRFILMNSTGCVDTDKAERTSLPQRFVVGALRWLVPPHADNEQAADYLRSKIGKQHASMEWVIVRPDALINESAVSPYDLHASPIRSAIFDSGKSSRINVGHFMVDLVTNQKLWDTWKGQAPVLYNRQQD